MMLPELQIRGVIVDNSKIIFLISQQKHVVTSHLNCLEKTVLMMCLKYVLMEKYE